MSITAHPALELARALDIVPPTRAPRDPHPDLPGALLDALDRVLYGQRVAILRVEWGEWEARRFDGQVGRGATLLEAIEALIEECDLARRVRQITGRPARPKGL